MYLKRYKEVFKFLIVVLPIFSLYFLYAYFLDWQLFTKLWQLQLHRYDLAFNSIFAIFTSPFLADRYLTDGWIYFGWISFFMLMFGDLKKNYMVIFGFLAYFAVFTIAIPNEPGHGWYRYPFYPFLVTCIAVFLRNYFNKNHLLTFFFLLFNGLALLQLSWAQVFGFSFVIMRFYLVLASLSLLPVFFSGQKVLKFSGKAGYFTFLLLIMLNLWTVSGYNEQ